MSVSGNIAIVMLRLIKPGKNSYGKATPESRKSYRETIRLIERLGAKE